jgi:hypothetical protein
MTPEGTCVTCGRPARLYAGGRRCEDHKPQPDTGTCRAPRGGHDDIRDRLRWAAVGLAERGWHVFPCVPGGKRPAIEAWERRATTDTTRIARCWTTGPFNIGIACGPSGLVVLDLDVPKPGQRPPAGWDLPGIRDGADTLAALCERHGQPMPFGTYTVRTASGGQHLYYAAPARARLRNTAGRLGWLIDTRAGGGYVIAAGSLIGGRPYTVTDPAPAAPLPAWLARLLAAEPAPPAVTPGDGHPAPAPARYAMAALRSETQRVLDAAEGHRNDTLNAAAFALGQLVAAGMLPATLAYDALLAAARRAGLDRDPNCGPRGIDRTIRSGLASGALKPRRAA